MTNPVEVEQSKKQLGALGRFRAFKMALESVFFQTDTFSERESSGVRLTLGKGLLGVAVIALAHFVVLALWVAGSSRPLTPQESIGVAAVQSYDKLWKAGDLAGMMVSVKTDDGKPLSPMYYWVAMAGAQVLPVTLKKAILLTNALYLAIIALSVFLIVRYSRMDKSAWLGAVFATCLPFVLQASRQISPDIAVVAWAAGCYASFIWSEEFCKARPAYLFGLCFLCGMLTSWLFPLFVLPLLLYFIDGLVDSLSARRCFNIMMLTIFLFGAWLWLNLPALGMWLLREAFAPANGPALSSLGKVTWHLWQGIDSAGLPLFLLALALNVWMLSAEFMPYPKRRLLFNWFAVTYIAMIFVPLKEARLFWPGLIAIAPAVGIMTPNILRIPVLGVCLFFGLTGFIDAKKITFFGHPVTFIGTGGAIPESGLGKLLAAGKPFLPAESAYNTAVALNAPPSMTQAWLAAQARQAGLTGLSFVKDADTFLRYPALVLRFAGGDAAPALSTDTARTPVGAASPQDTPPLFASAHPADPANWFSRYYAPVAQLSVKDPLTGKPVRAALYGLRRFTVPPATPGTALKLGDVKAGQLTLSDLTFVPGEWDAAAGCYKSALFSASILNYKNAEMYGAELELKNLALDVQNGQLRILRLDSALLRKGYLSGLSLAGYMQEQFVHVSSVEVSVSADGLSVGFDYGRHRVAFSGSVVMAGTPPMPELQLTGLSFKGFSVPAIMARSQKYTLDSQPSPDRPFELRFAPLTLSEGSIRIGVDAFRQSAEQEQALGGSL